jgi:hypothetical protein
VSDESVQKDVVAESKRSGTTVVQYEGAGHIFADRDLPDYNVRATEAWKKNVLAFLGTPSTGRRGAPPRSCGVTGCAARALAVHHGAANTGATVRLTEVQGGRTRHHAARCLVGYAA